MIGEPRHGTGAASDQAWLLARLEKKNTEIIYLHTIAPAVPAVAATSEAIVIS